MKTKTMKRPYLKTTKQMRAFGQDVSESRTKIASKKFPKRLTHDEIKAAMAEYDARGGKITILVPANRSLEDIMAHDNGDYVNEFVNGV